MNTKQRLFIAQKSDVLLAVDIERYRQQIESIPRRMQITRISANKRLQAHIDELQIRMLQEQTA